MYLIEQTYSRTVGLGVKMNKISIEDAKMIAVFSSPDIIQYNTLIITKMLKNTIEGRLSILKDSKNCFIVLHVT
jgi:hypothetical protein